MPLSERPLCLLPARRLATLIRRRELSSREVVRAFLDRIDALNPRFNAIVSRVETEAALAQADAADAAVARGDTLGALHGLPLAIKDTVPVRGLRSTFGSPLFAQNVPREDALVAARLRAAGGIFIGKTNVPEFGLGSHTYNPVFGPTRNAWDPERSAGGSSGGAAVAVALRLLPLADGSDLAGSLRNPAAFNHVLGLRPSQGRVPHVPGEDLFFKQLVTAGPMARSADDLALLLSVLGGHDARAPLSLEGAVPDWGDRLARDFRGARIGWLGDWGGHLPFEDGILALCRGALERLGAAGLTMEDVDGGIDGERLWRAFVVLRQFSIGGDPVSQRYDDASSRRQMKPELQWEIEQGRALTVAQVQRAARDRSAWYERILGLFGEYDFLALPAAQVFPFPVEWPWPRRIADRAMDSYHRWMEVAVPGTLSGCPVVSLPVGFGPGGLPMGVQVIGRPRDDLSVLQLAHAYEQLAPWMTDLPPAIRDTGAPPPRPEGEPR